MIKTYMIRGDPLSAIQDAEFPRKRGTRFRSSTTRSDSTSTLLFRPTTRSNLVFISLDLWIAACQAVCGRLRWAVGAH